MAKKKQVWYTSINIGKRWHEKLRKEAQEREMNMYEIVHEALDEWFQRHSKKKDKEENQMTADEWIELIESKREELIQAMIEMTNKAFEMRKGIFEVILDNDGRIRKKIYFSKPYQDGKTVIGKAVPILRVYGNRLRVGITEKSREEACQDLDLFIDIAIDYVKRHGHV